MKNKLFQSIKIPWSAFIKIHIPVIFFLFVVLVINIVGDMPFSRLTRDPVSIAGLNPLSGIVSNFGVLLWSAATSICFFAAALIYTWDDTENARFLFFSGLLTLFLLLDDFFVIHESLRDYFGIPEKASYAIYLLFIGSYLVTFRKQLLNKNITMLIIAFGFLGGSATIDIFQKLISNEIPGYFFLEDGLKLMGIASWAGFFAYTAFEHITGQVERQVRKNDREG